MYLYVLIRLCHRRHRDVPKRKHNKLKWYTSTATCLGHGNRLCIYVPLYLSLLLSSNSIHLATLYSLISHEAATAAAAAVAAAAAGPLLTYIWFRTSSSSQTCGSLARQEKATLLVPVPVQVSVLVSVPVATLPSCWGNCCACVDDAFLYVASCNLNCCLSLSLSRETIISRLPVASCRLPG